MRAAVLKPYRRNVFPEPDCVGGQSTGFKGYYFTGGGSYLVESGLGLVGVGAEGEWMAYGDQLGMTAGVSLADNVLTIIGPSGDIGNPSYFSYVITIPSDGTITFSFKFSWHRNALGNMTDYEEAGTILNGDFFPFAVSSDYHEVFSPDPFTEGNNLSSHIVVSAGDIFGFYVSSQGTDSHPAILEIGNISMPCIMI